MFMRKFLLLSISILLLAACQQQESYVQISGYTMGTTYNVTIEKKQLEPELLRQQIDARLERINLLMSTYIDDSELSLFNASSSTQCQELSPETLYVTENAIKVSQQTGGKFDATLAPLIEIWGFDKKQTNDVIPSQQVISKMLSQIGFQKIDFQGHCVAKTLPHLSMNFSAIAKGYAVDEIAKLVASQGVENYLVEIGGEVANRGVNAKGNAWRIAIESADTAQRSIQRVLAPQGLGVATSGSYRNYFEKDGKRFSHTIDPTTGYPITHTLASVTVLHEETMMADAIATAMMVMGPDESLAFAEQHQLAIFMLVKKDNTFIEVYSSAYKPHL